MQLKNISIFIFTAVCVIYNSSCAIALEETDAVSEKYLIDHGHSKEIIRMINIQRNRAEGKTTAEVEVKRNNRFGKFIKNLWFEQDLTLPVTDFGYREVKTVETRELIPSGIKKFFKKENDNKNIEIPEEVLIPDPEIMINEVTEKIEETDSLIETELEENTKISEEELIPKPEIMINEVTEKIEETDSFIETELEENTKISEEELIPKPEIMINEVTEKIEETDSLIEIELEENTKISEEELIPKPEIPLRENKSEGFNQL